MLTIYILEIKNRFLLSIFSTVLIIITCYCYKETLLFFSVKPNIIDLKSKVFYFIVTNITDILSTYLKLCYFIGIQGFILILLYHFIKFLTPGLYTNEIKKIKLCLFISVNLWFILFMFFYKFILPITWNFFFSFQHSTSSLYNINLFFEAKLTEYIDFYILIYCNCMFIWLFFVSIILLLNFLTYKTQFIKKSRKIFYIIFYFIATIITPPDIISQIILGNVFILFYEIAIITTILQKLLKLIG